MPLPPAANEMYGIASQTLGVGIYQTSGTVYEECSDGSSQTVVEDNIGVYQSHGSTHFSGSFCRVYTNDGSLIGVGSWGDGDGKRSNIFERAPGYLSKRNKILVLKQDPPP